MAGNGGKWRDIFGADGEGRHFPPFDLAHFRFRPDPF
jgi:hypothetical protein